MSHALATVGKGGEGFLKLIIFDKTIKSITFALLVLASQKEKNLKILLAQNEFVDSFNKIRHSIFELAGKSLAIAFIVIGGLLLYAFLQGGKNARDKKG